jgi:hypothetical protein
MKKFFVNCDFNGQIAPFSIYIGVPEGSHHPLHFQADWLGKNRGGSIPPDVMDAIARLKDLADKNKVPLEDLCVYALGAAQQDMDQTQDSEEDEDFDFDDLVSTPFEESAESEALHTTQSDELPSEGSDEFLNEELNKLDENNEEFIDFDMDLDLFSDNMEEEKPSNKSKKDAK